MSAKIDESVTENPEQEKVETSVEEVGVKTSSTENATADDDKESPAVVDTANEDDDTEEANEGKITLSQTAFNKRIARAGKSALSKFLKEEMKIDDPKELKSLVDEAIKLKKQMADAEREKLSEIERYKQDLETAKQAKLEAEERVTALELARSEEQALRFISTAANKVIDSDYLEVAELAYQSYLDSLSEAEIDDLDEKSVHTFFAKYAKDHPALAKAQTRKKKKEGVTNTSSQEKTKKPESSTGTTTGKTVKLGEANSMTASEYHKWLQEQGLEY